MLPVRQTVAPYILLDEGIAESLSSQMTGLKSFWGQNPVKYGKMQNTSSFTV